MGFFFGNKTGSCNYTYTEHLGRKLRKKGGDSSTGATHLLDVMTGVYGGDGSTLRAEEAEQAAASLRQTARKLRGQDRRVVEQIAADAQAAADNDRRWTIR